MKRTYYELFNEKIDKIVGLNDFFTVIGMICFWKDHNEITEREYSILYDTAQRKYFGEERV